MQLTQAQVRQFQLLYQKHFSIELSKTEAEALGGRLVKLIRSVQKASKAPNQNYNEQTRPAADL